jgi:hypothetical protein
MQTRSPQSQTNSELEERCRIGDSFTVGFQEHASEGGWNLRVTGAFTR